jgi:hypothetical protein
MDSLETGTDAVCRVCLSGREETAEELIRPCDCNDPIHPSCLDKWRSTGINPTAMTHCSVCKTPLATACSLDGYRLWTAVRGAMWQLVEKRIVYPIAVMGFFYFVGASIGNDALVRAVVGSAKTFVGEHIILPLAAAVFTAAYGVTNRNVAGHPVARGA